MSGERKGSENLRVEVLAWDLAVAQRVALNESHDPLLPFREAPAAIDRRGAFTAFRMDLRKARRIR